MRTRGENNETKGNDERLCEAGNGGQERREE
jgi:hypothetical protein